ncbi:hypothetical protein [Haladaptatus cibarius]|uniref:hypothetical protein n=1 Tax=Haladaptatus cibarius TaxID=453847 RepID=UPI0006799436|nr:hypothetical protein [Haladaptatus cibarius]
MVVLSENDGEYFESAEQIASDRNEEVITELDDIGDEEPVIYVGSSDDLDESILLALQRRLSDNGPSQGCFSVITGFTPSLATDLYRREERDAEEDCLLLKSPPKQYEPGSGETVITRSANDTAEQLASLEEKGLSSLSMHIGGFPLHIFLNGGILCGYPTRVDPDSYDGRQPQCVQNGERNCPLNDGELIPVDEFTVDHSFMASCASMIGNGPSGLPVHVGTGMLVNGTSLIGGYRISPIDPIEPLLHHSLIKAGYDVIERCYLLNEFSTLNDIQADAYIPFGHPEAGGDPEKEPPSDCSIYQSEGETRMEVTVDGYIGDFRIPLSELPETDDRYYLRTSAPTDGVGDRYYLAFQENDTLRVLLFAGRQMESEQFELVVSDTMVGDEKLQTMFDCLDTLDRHRRLGMLGDSLAETAQTFQNDLLDTHHTITRERLNLDTHHQSRSILNDLYDQIDELSKGLLEPLENGSSIVGQYVSRAIDDDTLVADQDCIHCGRPVFIKQVSDLSGEAHRALGECPQCAQLFDVPTTPGETDPVCPVVEGELFDTTDSRREFTVTFENNRDVTSEVVIYPTIWQYGDTNRNGKQLFNPQITERTIEPGETAHVTFEVDAAALEENQYYITTHVVSNLDVYSEIGTTMLVGEKTGYMPPYRQ